MRLSRADRQILLGLGAALALVTLVVGAPRLMLRRGTSLAHECLAAPAGRDDASCARAEADLARLADVPWTRHDATYRYEELRARRALAAYEEACFGFPDPVARARTGATLAIHEEIVGEGSKRLRLEELGPPIGAPDAGMTAHLRGDRATLLDRWDHVGGWPVRVAALRSALQDGELATADRIAARYAEFDPRDADLRTAVGAVLCLGPDPGRGLEVLARVPGDRAAERSAAIARHWGEVRAVQEACADLASIEPPPMPIERHAGIPDADELRATLALRLARGAEETREAIDVARDLLAEDPPPEGPGLSPRVASARAALLAALVLADPSLDARSVQGLARPRADREPPLAPPPWRSSTWVMRQLPPDVPWLPPADWTRASRRVEELAGGEGLPGATSSALREVGAAFAVHAARGFVGSGEADLAIAEARRATELSPRGADGDALLLAEIAAASGTVTTARETVARALAGKVDTAGHPATAPEPPGAGVAPRVAMLLADALAAATDARPDDVRKDLAKARELAAGAALGPLSTELALWSLAFSDPDPGAAKEAPLARPAWIGFAAPAASWSDGSRIEPVEALDQLAPLLAQPDGAARRAARRTIVARGGDAPPALVPWVVALARLAPDGATGEAVETWLDAALAVDVARFSMREVAHARAISAHIRGDHDIGNRWEERLAALRALYRDPRRAVAARFLGI